MIESIPSVGYKVINLPTELISLLQSLIFDSLLPKNSYSLSTSFIFEELPGLLMNLETSSRSFRTIPPEIVRAQSNRILDYLGLVISKPASLLNDDLYFRVVRPCNSEEISIPHRDCYFHSILPEWRQYLSTTNLKLWLPLMPVGQPSLGVVPCSHTDENFKDVVYEYLHDLPVSFISSIKPTDLSPVHVAFGQGLLFPPTLIHGSLPRNQLSAVRLSVELTLGFGA